MAVCTVAYAGMCWVFLSRWGWGSEGLVWANIGNMVLRIAWGGWFVDGWIRRNGEGVEGEVGRRRRFWRKSMPSKQCVGIGVAVGVWLKSGYYGVGAGEAGARVTRKKLLLGSDLDVGDVGKVVAGVVLMGSSM